MTCNYYLHCYQPETLTDARFLFNTGEYGYVDCNYLGSAEAVDEFWYEIVFRTYDTVGPGSRARLTDIAHTTARAKDGITAVQVRLMFLLALLYGRLRKHPN